MDNDVSRLGEVRIGYQGAEVAEPKHTPGPWRVLEWADQRKGFIAVVGPSDPPEHVCDIFPFGKRAENQARKTYDANAHLIAAAPDLLLVAQFDECLDFMSRDGSAAEFLQDHGWDMQGPWTAEEWVRGRRNEAIAKATMTAQPEERAQTSREDTQPAGR